VTRVRLPTLTVLIVEDHGDTREMYVELLSSVGLSTVDVDTADQALRHLEEIRPQVIVTDLRLGSGPDGFALCERLKHNPRTKDIPVIVVTSVPEDKHLLRRAESAGCAVVWIKPFDPFALLAEVLRLIR
jgi:CheY-like chemotaxis protein